MATPTFITGFESGVASAQGGGLATAMSGVPTIEVGSAKSGDRCLKLTSTGAGAVNFRRNTSGSSVQIAVARAYFRIPTGGMPSATASIIGWQITTAAVTVGVTITSAGSIRGIVGGGSSITGPDVVLDTWHMVELRANITGTTWTLDWAVDGVAQTQAVWTGQATNDALQYLRLGSASSTLNAVICFDDVIMSETSGDHPLGPGATKLLSPNSANADNVGVNVIEESNGTDASSSSYQALNSVPMGDATNYIRQAANGNTNYLEVAFPDLTEPHSSIIGAMALLAYTSETTTANRGGCIVSKDNFSSFSVVWGQQSATADYSDGSTSSVFWKSVIVAGAVDDTTVNALAMRLGYSDDASPDPYWIDVGIEVAYVPSNDIDLDLVTYSSTINAIDVLENIVESLDLVSYSSTINDITVTENIPESLDLVSYSIVVNDITVTENVVETLDLVSYSISFPDITILESVIETLDLVSYSSNFLDITETENIVESLDLVTYSNTFFDIDVLENVVEALDLVSYIIEVYDIELLEEGDIPLDLVEYISVFEDLSVLESELVLLDLVEYSSIVNDISVLEAEDVLLDLVLYTSSIYGIELEEAGDLSLDLVVYSSVIYDLTIEEPDTAFVPVERTYAISERHSLIVVHEQIRIVSVDHQDRTIY